MPLVSGLALRTYWAKGRTKGIARKWKGNLYGGHSRRREANSGGKAETEVSNDFSGKARQGTKSVWTWTIEYKKESNPSESEKSKWIGVCS